MRLNPHDSGQFPSNCCKKVTHISPFRNPGRRRAGFTLVEIMVVVTIISLLVALAVPAMILVKRQSLATAVANDLRVFATAFEVDSHESGTWPAEVDAGVMPPEMASRLAESAWLRPTPIGGHYNWENAQTHGGKQYRAAIAVSSSGGSTVLEDVDLFEAIDRILDDGNLSSGSFVIGSDNEPVFVVAP